MTMTALAMHDPDDWNVSGNPLSLVRTIGENPDELILRCQDFLASGGRLMSDVAAMLSQLGNRKQLLNDSAEHEIARLEELLAEVKEIEQ